VGGYSEVGGGIAFWLGLDVVIDIDDEPVPLVRILGVLPSGLPPEVMDRLSNLFSSRLRASRMCTIVLSFLHSFVSARRKCSIMCMYRPVEDVGDKSKCKTRWMTVPEEGTLQCNAAQLRTYFVGSGSLYSQSTPRRLQRPPIQGSAITSVWGRHGNAKLTFRPHFIALAFSITRTVSLELASITSCHVQETAPSPPP